MNIWAWRWGRLAWCTRHYDQIINWKHLVWRLWLRRNPTDVLLEKIAIDEQAEMNDWWESRKREALAESQAVDAALEGVDTFLYTYDPTDQVTELCEPGHIPLQDTAVIRPRAP